MAGKAWQWEISKQKRAVEWRGESTKALDVVVRVEERQSWMLHEADVVERARTVVAVGEAEEVSDRVRGRLSGKRRARTAKHQLRAQKLLL